MRLLFPVVLFLLSAVNANADFRGGLVMDSSSNMLMRPGGDSGVYSLIYGEYSHDFSEKLMASGGFTGGFIERYNGLQYQRYDLSVWYGIVSKQNFAWSAGADVNVSRFADVTIIDGYEQGALRTNLKSYLTQSLLFRWEGLLKQRSYRTFDSENYMVAESTLRLDKFLESRTTLRLQFDAGVRSYREIEGSPHSSRYAVSGRIAQSFGDRIGLSLDAKASTLSSESVDGGGTNIFNRIFLDDNYKYSDEGFSAQLRYLFPAKGSMTLKGAYDVRTYGKGSLESFFYLPENGWTETEQGVSMIIAYRFAFVPDRLSPSLELYYTDIDASESYLSYSSTGVSFRLSF